MNTLIPLAEQARQASFILANASTQQKNKVLHCIADKLIQQTHTIILANQQDLENAKQNAMSNAMIDRLTLTKERIESMAQAVLEIELLSDPIGQLLDSTLRPNGLKIDKISVPLGVLGFIYEARPNVTIEAASLCIKSSNVVILRGGKEALQSNCCLVELMREALREHDLPEDCIQLITDTRRTSAVDLMTCTGYIDALIPRGGKNLIQSVIQNSKVPVIETGAGNCHIYVDEFVNIAQAISICVNAKVSRPAVCNSVETILIHKNIAEQFLPTLVNELVINHVDVRGCPQCKQLVPTLSCATEEDYETEYNDLIVAIKIVDTIDEAIQHIRRYTTHHSEAILTTMDEHAKQFTSQLDSAVIYVNASTRFTDGNEFGFGSEIGISTQKLHVRGPIGLREITSYKYIITGDGQIR
ncbi:glutamate-5-semialdehyde dehydrogenase [Anaerorhabdus sp.]|uniref:glutamate-5-semialdehyde dehydrogenase n=1 Tax=Anaerorhabdus sp. TaxID=1872524 RepID=UPI002FC84EA3